MLDYKHLHGVIKALHIIEEENVGMDNIYPEAREVLYGPISSFTPRKEYAASLAAEPGFGKEMTLASFIALCLPRDPEQTCAVHLKVNEEAVPPTLELTIAIDSLDDIRKVKIEEMARGLLSLARTSATTVKKEPEPVFQREVLDYLLPQYGITKDSKISYMMNDLRYCYRLQSTATLVERGRGLDVDSLGEEEILEAAVYFEMVTSVYGKNRQYGDARLYELLASRSRSEFGKIIREGLYYLQDRENKVLDLVSSSAEHFYRVATWCYILSTSIIAKYYIACFTPRFDIDRSWIQLRALFETMFKLGRYARGVDRAEKSSQ
ncbi:hypothetical protein BJ508DRAFT_85210 [Ascobolus immersus RN42]|uniref:Uncharacterized protein n=1 Tax=Ascobolus immersus RN42 TaxID=1160509 RepID=A0A3N4HHL2_ASCIM|nr:hypothetical protein BJ508DRAFT_85210 [Ascobolus immersus RN42]